LAVPGLEGERHEGVSVCEAAVFAWFPGAGSAALPAIGPVTDVNWAGVSATVVPRDAFAGSPRHLRDAVCGCRQSQQTTGSFSDGTSARLGPPYEVVEAGDAA